MQFDLHAPSQLVLLVSLALAVLAVVCYFVVTPATVALPFWLAILAYAVAATCVHSRPASGGEPQRDVHRRGRGASCGTHGRPHAYGSHAGVGIFHC